ncbi:MAG TPA: branched-chain amino acid ABC transporter permease [Candidatus Kapabacteria bacterium]|nr:branched-chain amino acid ABC transporter permease [Candidatus Kapabacteria bacterium]
MSTILRPYLYLAAGIALVLVLNVVVGGIGSYDQRIVVNIGINMILAVSLNLVNGFTGQFSLGHAGFMSVGAYASAAFTTMVLPSTSDPLTQGLFFIVALLVGGLAAAVAGLLVGVPSLRLKGDYLAIVTLGFGEIIRVILQNVSSLGGALGLANIPRHTTFLWVFIVLTLVVFVIERVIRTTYGKGFLAVRDDEIAAEAMGVNTTRYKVVAFVVGAFFAGIAGGLYAHYNSLIKPDDFGFLKSVEIVVMVILGGMGSTYGVIFAAAALTYLPEWLRSFTMFGIKFSDFRMSIYSLVLIVLMLVRPQGLFGGINFKGRRSAAKKAPIG